MTRPKWQAIGILITVFMLGAVAGGGAVAAWHAKQRRDAAVLWFGMRGDRPMIAMMRRLDLSGQQRQAIEALLERHAPQRRAIMREMMGKCGQELAKEKALLDTEIRAILSPTQRDQFDELSERQRERLMGPSGPHRRHGGS